MSPSHVPVSSKPQVNSPAIPPSHRGEVDVEVNTDSGLGGGRTFMLLMCFFKFIMINGGEN